jgi:hypothetical protein
MTDKAENQSASQGAGEGSASGTESARSQNKAFEHLCEEIRSAMAGCRPWPQYCMPPEYCMPPLGHHPHYHQCGPSPYYCGPPPPLSLLHHMFQFAGARAHFWHRWFESLAGTGYRPSWHDSYCYDPCHPKYDPCYSKYDPCYPKYDPSCSTYDPCCSMPELPDCEEFKDIKCAIKEFLGQLSDDQKKKYEPVLCEMIHCVLMMRRMDTMRRKPHLHRKYASAGAGWH